jgi:threonine dehydrogenase-like Zn-dependent dehydrogenase
MRSARLDFADPECPVTVAEVDEPALPRGDWARVQVLAGGICGSDLHAIFPDGSGSPTMLPLVGFPMEMGHEMGGVVVEAGPDCPVPVGARVAVDGALTCIARGTESPCPKCAAGLGAACEQLNPGSEPQGFGHGFATGVGGGWSDQLVAHHSQLHVAPDGVDDLGLALCEPLSIAGHGLLRRLPAEGAPVLVIGAGTIGLAAVAALRALAPSSEITVVARHPHQAAAATRLGAHRVIGDELGEIVAAGGGRVTGKGRATLVYGGFPYVVDAVGTPATFTQSLKVVDTMGVVLLLGAIAAAQVDLNPLWFKNADVVGSFGYQVQDGVHTFDRSLEVLAAGGFPSDVVVTHTFDRSEVREALRVANARDEGAIKVALV